MKSWFLTAYPKFAKVELLYSLQKLLRTPKEERTLTRYNCLKNISSSLEYFLRELGGKKTPPYKFSAWKASLSRVIETVMGSETWFSSIRTPDGKKFLYDTMATDTTSYFANLSAMQPITTNFWGYNFSVAQLVRNFTIHNYTYEQRLYQEPFSYVLNSIIYCIFYSWYVAKRDGWAI